MVVGAFCAAGAGVVMPLFSIIFGDILDAFHGANPTKEVCTHANWCFVHTQAMEGAVCTFRM